MKPSVSQLRRLIGNPDAYALQNEDGSWTPVRKPLTDAVLQHHHEANRTTVGTYVGHGSPTQARTLVFDIDDGSEPPGPLPSALADLGIPPRFVGIEDSGRKGYHVWVVLQQYRPNPELRRVGRAAAAIAGVQCEVFPKQDEVRDLGNLVKLPGGKHQVSGKPNDFIGPVPQPLPVPVWQRVLDALPPEQRARREYVDNRFPCLEHIQAGPEEGGRNNSLFQLATMFRRHGATPETVSLIVHDVNRRSPEPLDDAEVENVIDSSATSGPICTPEMRERCQEACILERTGNLEARGGQLKYAQEGERVVVTLDRRAGTSVTLSHEDLISPVKGRVVVRGRDEE
jgi:hypothetical protein